MAEPAAHVLNQQRTQLQQRVDALDAQAAEQFQDVKLPVSGGWTGAQAEAVRAYATTMKELAQARSDLHAITVGNAPAPIPAERRAELLKDFVGAPSDDVLLRKPSGPEKVENRELSKLEKANKLDVELQSTPPLTPTPAPVSPPTPPPVAPDDSSWLSRNWLPLVAGLGIAGAGGYGAYSLLGDKDDDEEDDENDKQAAGVISNPTTAWTPAIATQEVRTGLEKLLPPLRPELAAVTGVANAAVPVNPKDRAVFDAIGQIDKALPKNTTMGALMGGVTFPGDLDAPVPLKPFVPPAKAESWVDKNWPLLLGGSLVGGAGLGVGAAALTGNDEEDKKKKEKTAFDEGAVAPTTEVADNEMLAQAIEENEEEERKKEKPFPEKNDPWYKRLQEWIYGPNWPYFLGATAAAGVPAGAGAAHMYDRRRQKYAEERPTSADAGVGRTYAAPSSKIPVIPDDGITQPVKPQSFENLIEPGRLKLGPLMPTAEKAIPAAAGTELPPMPAAVQLAANKPSFPDAADVKAGPPLSDDEYQDMMGGTLEDMEAQEPGWLAKNWQLLGGGAALAALMGGGALGGHYLMRKKKEKKRKPGEEEEDDDARIASAMAGKYSNLREKLAEDEAAMAAPYPVDNYSVFNPAAGVLGAAAGAGLPQAGALPIPDEQRAQMLSELLAKHPGLARDVATVTGTGSLLGMATGALGGFGVGALGGLGAGALGGGILGYQLGKPDKKKEDKTAAEDKKKKHYDDELGVNQATYVADAAGMPEVLKSREMARDAYTDEGMGIRAALMNLNKDVGEKYRRSVERQAYSPALRWGTDLVKQFDVAGLSDVAQLGEAALGFTGDQGEQARVLSDYEKKLKAYEDENAPSRKATPEEVEHLMQITPRAVTAAGRVTAADKLIAAMRYGRNEHPIQYWLNPLQRSAGPLNEIGYRLNRRADALYADPDTKVRPSMWIPGMTELRALLSSSNPESREKARMIARAVLEKKESAHKRAEEDPAKVIKETGIPYDPKNPPQLPSSGPPRKVSDTERTVGKMVGAAKLLTSGMPAAAKIVAGPGVSAAKKVMAFLKGGADTDVANPPGQGGARVNFPPIGQQVPPRIVQTPEQKVTSSIYAAQDFVPLPTRVTNWNNIINSLGGKPFQDESFQHMMFQKFLDQGRITPASATTPDPNIPGTGAPFKRPVPSVQPKNAAARERTEVSGGTQTKTQEQYLAEAAAGAQKRNAGQGPLRGVTETHLPTVNTPATSPVAAAPPGTTRLRNGTVVTNFPDKPQYKPEDPATTPLMYIGNQRVRGGVNPMHGAVNTNTIKSVPFPATSSVPAVIPPAVGDKKSSHIVSHGQLMFEARQLVSDLFA